MDELKNLMIQTLEANGILGQLRAQIRCSVFKIIDSQDEMEDPRQRGKSALHWENKKAREILNTPHGLLLAELVREYLEFFKLDYTKQIYMPESNLGTKDQRSTEQLAAQSGLDAGRLNPKKPLLLQMLESFQAGGGGVPPAAGKESLSSSPNAAPGVQFSDEKQGKVIEPLSIGEGILPKEGASPQEEKTTTNKHLEKANSLLDELSREERSGFKAEIAGLDKGSSEYSKERSAEAPKRAGGSSPPADEKRRTSEVEDNYEDEFEEIDEDLPMDDNDIEGSQLPNMAKIGESHGITVS